MEERNNTIPQNKEIVCSVIIPTYNNVDVIENCLRSLRLDEEYTYDLEVLIVNDGSKDDTSALVAQWCKNYQNVKLLEKENGGVSSARNYGIKEARGKYVYFADADDEIERQTLDEMIGKAENTGSEIVIADYIQKNIDTNQDWYISSNIPEGIQEKTYIQEIIFKRYFNGEASGLSTTCNKLYLKEVIDKNRLIFDEKKTYGEDLWFNVDFLSHTSFLYALPKTVYYYKLENRNYNHFIRYKKGLAYSLIDGHKRFLELNDAFLHYEKKDKEYIAHMRNFAFQSLKYLSLKKCTKKGKKNFLSSKEEKKLWGYMLKLDNYQLQIAGYSRIDKIAFFLLRIRQYKLALKLLKIKEG